MLRDLYLKRQKQIEDYFTYKNALRDNGHDAGYYYENERAMLDAELFALGFCLDNNENEIAAAYGRLERRMKLLVTTTPEELLNVPRANHGDYKRNKRHQLENDSRSLLILGHALSILRNTPDPNTTWPFSHNFVMTSVPPPKNIR